MSYQKERDTFISIMAEEGVEVDVARSILRDAQTIARIAVDVCNRQMSEQEAARVEKQDEQASNRIAKRLAPYGIAVDCSGDPRGFVVKLHLKSRKYNTWGGEETGYGVPTRN